MRGFRTILILMVLVSSIAQVADGAKDSVLFRSAFEKETDLAHWSGWTESGTVTVRRSPMKDGPGKNSWMGVFSIPSGEWNTPIVAFPKPVLVSEKTVVRFRIKTDSSGPIGMNIRNKTDGGEYFINLPIPKAGEWIAVQKYLKEGSYKRWGNPAIPKDGLLGDRIESIQIAAKGHNVYVSDFEIVNVAGRVKELPEEEKLLEGEYRPRQYAGLEKVFPFGVILNVGPGDGANAAYFGQTLQERFEADLLDVKRHYMNTVANFNDGDDVAYRVSMMDKYRMYLMETAFCGVDFASLTADHPAVQKMKHFYDSDRILLWYGKDEPKECKKYLQCKLAANKIDPNHPYASAFDQVEVAKILGPYMEVSMIDPYSIMQGTAKSALLLLSHADLIKSVTNQTAGKKVWLISQAMGRRGLANEGWLRYRYPYPEEIRFEVYNAISAGVKGIVFFIYNDMVTFLDDRVRGEEFDYTLVDGWGNDNPTYRELARIGKSIMPIMPSLLDAQSCDPNRHGLHYAKNKLTMGALKNGFGTFLVFANKDLDKSFDGAISIVIPKDENLYDLESLTPVSTTSGAKLSLLPGGGTIWLAATAEKYAEIRTTIQKARFRMEWDLLKVECDVLKKAKFGTHGLEKAINGSAGGSDPGKLETLRTQLEKLKRQNSNFCTMETELGQAQKTFGEINSRIISKIEKIDGTSDKGWNDIFNCLKTLGSEYFRLKRQWANGDLSGQNRGRKLIDQIQELKRRVESNVK